MTQRGPLHAKTERMWRLLTDSARTALNIVTHPDDMSVSEAIDLHKAAEELGLPRGKVVVNGVYRDLVPDEREHLRRMGEHARRRMHP